MKRSWMKLLLSAAVPLLLALVPSVADAQCVACKYNDGKARDTCQPSTNGGSDCSTDWDPQWGWSCWADGLCSSTTMQIDGTPAVFEGFVPGPADSGTEYTGSVIGEALFATVEERARIVRPCDGAVTERRYAAGTVAGMRERSQTFRI